MARVTGALSWDGFRFGIEHEFAVTNQAGDYCDFTNSTFDDFNRVLDQLPVFESDYPDLRVGDLGIKQKRWYIEGFERFSDQGDYLDTIPKGFEIRTPICTSLDQAIATLAGDIRAWQAAADEFGYRPVTCALNPFQREYVPDPPLNAWELAQRQSPEERTSHIHMLTSGPDISFSHPDLTPARNVDIGQKLTYYSPYIVPFSFTSPFHAGGLWGGLSRRTFYRTGPRPSVLVHVGRAEDVIPSVPTLTDRARIPAEVGRIEFKAFDCITDPSLYRALGTLLLGIALDDTLMGRALVPDAVLHQQSATVGFDGTDIRDGARHVLAAARAGLPQEVQDRLDPLAVMLETRLTPAHTLIEKYQQSGDILTAISQ